MNSSRKGELLIRVGELERFCASLWDNDDATAAHRVYWWLEALGVPNAEDGAEAAVNGLRAPWFQAGRLSTPMREAVLKAGALAAGRAVVGIEMIQGAMAHGLARWADWEFDPPFDPALGATAVPGLPSDLADAIGRLSFGIVMTALAHTPLLVPVPRGMFRPASAVTEFSGAELETELLEPVHSALGRLIDLATHAVRVAITAAVSKDATPRPVAEVLMAGAFPLGISHSVAGPVAVVVLPNAEVAVRTHSQATAEREYRCGLWHDALIERYGRRLVSAGVQATP